MAVPGSVWFFPKTRLLINEWLFRKKNSKVIKIFNNSPPNKYDVKQLANLLLDRKLSNSEKQACRNLYKAFDNSFEGSNSKKNNNALSQKNIFLRDF